MRKDARRYGSPLRTGQLGAGVSRPFWLLWLSQTLSRFGDGFFFLAVNWLVFQDTRSVWALGVMACARLGLRALAGVVLGPLSDRVDRRRLMIVLDGVLTLLMALPLALFLAGRLATWAIYGVVFVITILNAPYAPSAYAVLARVAPTGRLGRANALLAGGREMMYLVGPAVAGVVIARFGAPRAMAVDAATCALSALLLFALPPALGPIGRAPTRSGGEGTRPRYAASLAVGWRLIRSDPRLLALTVLNAIVGSTDTVFLVLMVPFVRVVLGGGATAVGLLEASLSGGVLLVSAFLARSEWAPRERVVALSVVVFGLMTAALAVAPNLLWALVLQALAGVAIGLFDIRSQVVFQSLVGDERLGRTLAARSTALAAAQAVAALVAGALPLLVGVAATFGVFGVAGATLGTVVTFRRRGGQPAATVPLERV
jgi:MFS family permease